MRVQMSEHLAGIDPVSRHREWWNWSKAYLGRGILPAALRISHKWLWMARHCVAMCL